MFASPLIEKLVESLRCLPGVGPKSAQRMALYLLERNREGGRHLAIVLEEALSRVGHCQRCRTLTEDEFCRVVIQVYFVWLDLLRMYTLLSKQEAIKAITLY